MMTPPSSSASARPRALLPDAVGPAMTTARISSVEDVADKSVGELGFEPGRLGRHDLVRIRHRDQLLERGRGEREGRAHLAAVDALLELGKTADTADEIDPLVAARVGNTKDRCDQIVLEQADVEALDRI